VPYRKLKYLPTVRRIPDELWNGMRSSWCFRQKKPNDTIRRPIISFRKVLDGIVYVLRTGCQWKMLPREYGSGSTTCHRRFQEWIVCDVFSE